VNCHGLSRCQSFRTSCARGAQRDGAAGQLAASQKAQRAQPVVDTLIKFQSGGIRVLCDFPSIATVKFQAIETPEDANTHCNQQDVAHIHKLRL
jgi:hypothetical protein